MEITGLTAIDSTYRLDSSAILNNKEKAYFNQVLNKEIFSAEQNSQSVQTATKADSRPGAYLGVNINRMI